MERILEAQYSVRVAPTTSPAISENKPRLGEPGGG